MRTEEILKIGSVRGSAIEVSAEDDARYLHGTAFNDHKNGVIDTPWNVFTWQGWATLEFPRPACE